MDKAKIFNLTILALRFLALLPKMESQIRPPPLCTCQFALANYACSTLPLTHGAPPSPPTRPSPPDPSPPSPRDDQDDDDNNNEHRHRNRHGHGHHRHRHRHHHSQTPQEDNCCRWAKEVDSQCVCEHLLRLPPLLVKPAHEYTVIIGESCNITYTCGGPL